MGDFKGYLPMPLILLGILNLLLLDLHAKIHLPCPILKHSIFYIIVEICFVCFVSFLTWFKNSIMTSTKHTQKDVDFVIDMYDNRKKDINRCSLQDLRRWIEESEYYKNDKENPFIDYLLIAKKTFCIEGFIFITHYFNDKLSFISYLVTNKKHDAKTSRKLFINLKPLLNNQLNKCDGIIAEIPKRKSKINHYFQLYDDICDKAGYKLWENEILYLEPNPLFKFGIKEREMVLVYAELKQNNDFMANKPPSKEKIIEILKFTYLRVFLDSVEKDFEESQKYLNGLFERVLEMNKSLLN